MLGSVAPCSECGPELRGVVENPPRLDIGNHVIEQPPSLAAKAASHKEQHFWGFYVPAVLLSFPGVLASPPHYYHFFGSLGCPAPSHLPGIKSTLQSGWTLDVDII